ncbi:MAG: hypothetical protein JJ931_01505 [Henriciella sp.]|nr:hypothetical protein [Henriciella sp.]MBO6694076.1 hypothetical protein [Henriciella sp.]
MRIAIFSLALFATPMAAAQNTGGIFSPVVNDDHRSAQYRVTYNPDTEGLAQRAHYQQSINGDLMWRGLVSARKTSDSDVDFDFVQAELFWELSDDDDRWKRGLRFDARIRDDDRPGLLGMHWTNQFPVTDNWNARIVALSAIDVGDDARDGAFLQTRGNVFTRLDTGQTVGVEVFNSYGSTDDFRDFEEQTHQIGPFASFPVAEDWSLFTGALLGLTDASADAELRIWVVRGF